MNNSTFFIRKNQFNEKFIYYFVLITDNRTENTMSDTINVSVVKYFAYLMNELH